MKRARLSWFRLHEKLLVPLLAKLSNFVPGGGIWMNTQRPDWNDANNALVGSGLSMVTVYQMRSYVQFLDKLFAMAEVDSYAISHSVVEFTQEVSSVLQRMANQRTVDIAARYAFVEALGRAGEKHRNSVYGGQSRSVAPLSVSAIRQFLQSALMVIDSTIHGNRRSDGMYHSYNLLRMDGREASLERLHLMLEGQVAVLGCGLLEPEEALAVLKALRTSDLYRPDQHSYLLYPDREIKPFLSRNTLPQTWTTRAPLLGDLIKQGRQDIVVLDVEGQAHFQSDMTNEGDLFAALDRLAEEASWTSAVARDRGVVTQLWEEVFDHGTFLGRSGTMFAFEGLGSIYWHMVAKLLLAVQENYRAAIQGSAQPEVIGELGDFYHDVRAGLGFTKTPQDYGAFPSDPYSHTPSHLGAQQPGMTGQVKEEILTRWGELGVQVADGSLCFHPRLLRSGEFLCGAHRFRYVALNGEEAAWDLPAESLAFTYCQIPICYQLADSHSIVLDQRQGRIEREGSSLSRAESAEVFSRSGSISRILVRVPRANLGSFD